MCPCLVWGFNAGFLFKEASCYKSISEPQGGRLSLSCSFAEGGGSKGGAGGEALTTTFLSKRCSVFKAQTTLSVGGGLVDNVPHQLRCWNVSGW